MCSRLCLMMVSLIFLGLWSIMVVAAKSSSSSAFSPDLPRRERRLDHLDAETLSFYLGLDPTTFEPLGDESSYVGYDVAVLFYAPWCQNCHTLAPYWDDMAMRIGAGSKDSNLIMGLFHCELDLSHIQLCSNVLGINKYPTLMYIGSGPFHDVNPLTRWMVGRKRSAGPMGATKFSRTVFFQGNWQYTESVMDWLGAMRALSSWQQGTALSRWLRSIRRILTTPLRVVFGAGNKGETTTLPIGLPSHSTASSGSTNDGGASATELKLLNKQLEATKEEVEQLNKLIVHASEIVDAIHFPRENGTDMYQWMAEKDAWDNRTDSSMPPLHQVVRACVMEMSLDYCARLSVHVTNEYLMANFSSDMTEHPSMSEMESTLESLVEGAEPFCGIFERCLEEDFASEACRPATCPFVNPSGCRCLTVCLEESLQKNYAIRLELIASEDDPFPPKELPIAAGKKTRGWGF